VNYNTTAHASLFLTFFARAGIRYRHLLRRGAYIILGRAGRPPGELEGNRFYVGYANGKTLETLFRYALLAGFAFYVLNQVRRPTEWVGRLFLWIMNSSHSGVTDWGLKHVRIEMDFKILDVGCGGGRTIEKLTALARSTVLIMRVAAWPHPGRKTRN
jgi:hypothetical protein